MSMFTAHFSCPVGHTVDKVFKILQLFKNYFSLYWHNGFTQLQQDLLEKELETINVP